MAVRGVQLYDTTLRDGTQQEGMVLTVQDKLAVARHLDAFGVGFIEGGRPDCTLRRCGWIPICTSTSTRPSWATECAPSSRTWAAVRLSSSRPANSATR